ncbi:MAG TPA: hypothetical protein VF395_16325 [Polyangiaceae bacterium]
MDRKAWLEALLGEELVAVRVRVREPDVVFIKSVLEASEGLGAVFAEPRSAGRGRQSGDGGAIVIAGPKSRARELREAIEDLKAELGGALWDDDPGA